MDHPDHGPLLFAKDVLLNSDYALKKEGATLRLRALPADTVILVARSNVNETSVRALPEGFPNRGALFLTRLGVRLLLAKSGKPEAQAYIRWALGDVQDAIEDTGGYILNEAARSTAKADTRTHVPLPEDIGGAYAALIAEKQARIAADMEALEAGQMVRDATSPVWATITPAPRKQCAQRDADYHHL